MENRGCPKTKGVRKHRVITVQTATRHELTTESTKYKDGDGEGQLPEAGGGDIHDGYHSGCERQYDNDALHRSQTPERV